MQIKEAHMSRIAESTRNTKETQISLKLNIDGTGKYDIDTGVGFLDHMLELFTRHGLFDMELKCTGDTHIDAHHTVEDIGIVLGQGIKEALGDKRAIKRYGSMLLPMDECMAMVAVDLGGRYYLSYDVDFAVEMLGTMETELIHEFFQAVAVNADMNLHIKMITPGNGHHMAEAIFKGFAKALDMATSIDDRIDGVMSTKGII